MTFERQSLKNYERGGDDSPKPRVRKANWLRGGLVCIAIGVVNIIYYLQTGKIILGPQSRGRTTPGFDLLMSVLVLVFGAVALGIHFAKSRD